MEIRKCTVAEAAAVGKFYDATIKFMDEHGVNHPKWLYKIFPTTEYAVDAARAGTQFICADGENILGGVRPERRPRRQLLEGRVVEKFVGGRIFGSSRVCGCS